MKHLVRRKEEQGLHCPRCGSADQDIKDVMPPVDIECPECHLKYRLMEFFEWEDNSTKKYRPPRNEDTGPIIKVTWPAQNPERW